MTPADLQETEEHPDAAQKTRAIYTDHEGYTGMRFELSDEASLGARISTVESLLESITKTSPGDRLILTRANRVALLFALRLLWTHLGREATQRAAASSPTVQEER